MRKAFLGAIVVCAVAVCVTSAAGAAPEPTTAAQANMSTLAGAVSYLRSLGIDPAGVVIQRGERNYAGPSCPGAGWECTTAHRVLQLATGPGGNTFSCSPAGSGTTAPNTCVIVQSSTTGSNVASCKLVSATSGVQQRCSITQTSVSGANRVDLKEERALTGAATSANQVATVEQNNGSGANVIAVNQASTEGVSSTGGSIGTWSQSVAQSLTIDQEADTGANSVEAKQAVSQAQSAPNATSGSQSQSSEQQAGIDQFSHGLSTVKIKQSESQSQTAKPSGSVTQTQSGPQRCCSLQADNPADTAEVKQEAKQVQNLPSGTQEEVQTVGYSSSGAIAGAQTTQQNGTASTNSFSGSTVSQQQGCTDGTCTQGPPPPPPPPPPPADWVVFNWIGGDGTPVGGSPFAVPAPAPVVLSVTDAFCGGDRFTISDGATTLGTTSVPGRTACDTQLDTTDPAVAFTDLAYSHGTFALAAGAHSVGLVASTSPFGQGGAFYSVDPMTPAHCTGGRWQTITSPVFASEASCLAFVGA